MASVDANAINGAGVADATQAFINSYRDYSQDREDRKAQQALAIAAVGLASALSAKRLLWSKEVQAELVDLSKWLDALDKAASDQVQERLDKLRTEVEEIAKKMSWPLLDGGYASLDHIEMLLNEYNYLSKLIFEKKLNQEFATDLGVGNFRNVLVKALPFIRLRQKLSPRYASHFVARYS